VQFAEATEVDQVLGSGQPQLHHRDQAVTAGERPRLFAEVSEKGDGSTQRGGTVIGERGWYHDAPP
jgi:hypothetical protein